MGGQEQKRSGRGRRHLQRILGIGLLAVVLVFCAVALRRNWDAVRSDLGLLAPVDYVLAASSAVAGLVLLWASWRAVLDRVDAHLPGRDSLTIYFSGQLGKYVPGSVWPAVIQARLGRRHGVRPASMVTGYIVWMGVLCAVGGVLGVLVLTSPGVEVSPTVLLAIIGGSLLALVALLHDRGLPRAVEFVAERRGWDAPPTRMGWSGSTQVMLWCLAAWIVLGLHAWVLARPLGAGFADLPLVVGGFALAFVAGVVAVPLPAGAGLREAVLVLTLGTVIGRPGAITVALMSRLVMIGAEILLAALTGVPHAVRAARGASSTADGNVSSGPGPDDAASSVRRP